MILLMLAAAAATAPVTLMPGQQVTLTVVRDIVIASPPAAASFTAFESASAARLANEACDQTNCGANFKMVRKGELPVTRPAPVKDTVRVTFAQIDGNSTLAFDNGFDQIMTYRARITVKGKTSATDVCQILPGLGGFEH